MGDAAAGGRPNGGFEGESDDNDEDERDTAEPVDKTNPYQSPQPTVIRDQAPPPPQAIYTETKYSQYETDSFQNSYDWARNQMMLDYPGTRESLQTLHSLIKQHQAATPTPTNKATNKRARRKES